MKSNIPFKFLFLLTPLFERAKRDFHPDLWSRHFSLHKNTSKANDFRLANDLFLCDIKAEQRARKNKPIRFVQLDYLCAQCSGFAFAFA